MNHCFYIFREVRDFLSWHSQFLLFFVCHAPLNKISLLVKILNLKVLFNEFHHRTNLTAILLSQTKWNHIQVVKTVMSGFVYCSFKKIPLGKKKFIVEQV
jgi:hypothetical protein